MTLFIVFFKQDCPVETEAGERAVALSAYWGEGVALVTVAAFGILGNTVSSVILGRYVNNLIFCQLFFFQIERLIAGNP